MPKLPTGDLLLDPTKNFRRPGPIPLSQKFPKLYYGLDCG